MQAKVVHDKPSTINPATGQVIHSYESTDIKQISHMVSNSMPGFEW